MILAISLVAIDQLIKWYISNNEVSQVLIPKILRITYTKNFGAIFGSFQGSNNILIILSATICTLLLIYIVKEAKKKSAKPYLIYMILAGGIGNLIDRIIRGYVIDYIDTPFIATFNFADSCIVIGVILLIIKEIKEIYRSE